MHEDSAPSTSSGNLAHWARLARENPRFDEVERNPKLDFAERLHQARNLCEVGDDGWIAVLAAALGSTNLVNWRSRDGLLHWCRSSPHAAAEALHLLWDAASPVEERLERANGAIPKEAVPSGTGTRLALLSVLLQADSPERWPVYRANVVAGASKITGLQEPNGDTPGRRYAAFLELLDHVLDDLRASDVSVRDRLEVQSLLHALATYEMQDPLFNSWSQEDRDRLAALRSTTSAPRDTRIWWVSQNREYGRERTGGYVSQSLDRLPPLLVRPGDLVLHYSGQAVRALGIIESEAVRREVRDVIENGANVEFAERFVARVTYHDLHQPVGLNEIPEELRKGAAPFDKSGRPKRRGYVFPLSRKFLMEFVRQFAQRLPLVGALGTFHLPFVVGSGGRPSDWEAERNDLLEFIATGGKATIWWSSPLQKKHEEALRSNPWLHVYVGAPESAVTARMHVIEHVTQPGSEGIVSPWPEFTALRFRDKRRIGEAASQVMKTWFLVDQIEEVEPALPVAHLVNEQGKSVRGGHLLNSFGLWSVSMIEHNKAHSESQLSELSHLTYMTEPALQEVIDLLLDKRQLILEGPPGSGKTYIADLMARHLTGNPLLAEADESLEVVQFHQSYGYEDFIQGIRPRTVDGHLEYHLEDGIFKRLCARARANPEQTFVLVIDEINRGNISRIFGELLLLLEYRDRTVVLPYSDEDDEPFSIPPNLLLIGTMNTTDRSLAQIDYALRRRFYFYRLMPTTSGEAPVLSAWLAEHVSNETDRRGALDWFLVLNEQLTREIGEHFQVGHSYLMQPGIGSPDALERVWRRAIRPLLEEYFYNRRGDQSTFIDGFAPGKLRPIASGAETVALDES